MESQSSNSTPPPARLHPTQIQGKEKYVRDTFREEAGLSDAQVKHQAAVQPQERPQHQQHRSDRAARSH